MRHDTTTDDEVAMIRAEMLAAIAGIARAAEAFREALSKSGIPPEPPRSRPDLRVIEGGRRDG